MIILFSYFSGTWSQMMKKNSKEKIATPSSSSGAKLEQSRILDLCSSATLGQRAHYFAIGLVLKCSLCVLERGPWTKNASILECDLRSSAMTMSGKFVFQINRKGKAIVKGFVWLSLDLSQPFFTPNPWRRVLEEWEWRLRVPRAYRESERFVLMVFLHSLFFFYGFIPYYSVFKVYFLSWTKFPFAIARALM